MRTGRILVVEDEYIVSRELEAQLIARGHTVVGIAETGTRALELADMHRPDLVIMDIQLRGPIDGTRTARTLRERFDLPSIFLSGSSDDYTIEQTEPAEPFGYIIKPHDERMLHVTVQSALYRRLAELEHRIAEEERRRADRAETSARLAASVVHEVNNLLSAIRVNAYLIQSEEGASKDLLESVQDIATAVSRGESLMGNLAGLARDRNATPLAIEVAELVRSTARRPDVKRHEAETEPPRHDNPAPREGESRGTVLVTDDDPVVRRAVSKFLEAWGCHVLDAKTPSEALAILERQPVDVLLTDLVMPQMSGYELAERAAHFSPAMRVIYMSGFEPETLSGSSTTPEREGDAYLQKPFDVESLKRALGDMLEARARS